MRQASLGRSWSRRPPTNEHRRLASHGLQGVKLVIADDHKGLRAAARRVFNATHQRCRLHWMRHALAYAPAKQRTAVAAILKTIFAQETKAEAEAQWGIVADALREKQPKLGALMDASRDDVLAYMSFLREHWPQIASTNPLERVNREMKRRADVIGIFPNDEATIRLVGALMLETNDEWAVARPYMSLETRDRIIENANIKLLAVAALRETVPGHRAWHPVVGRGIGVGDDLLQSPSAGSIVEPLGELQAESLKNQILSMVDGGDGGIKTIRLTIWN